MENNKRSFDKESEGEVFECKGMSINRTYNLKNCFLVSPYML